MKKIIIHMTCVFLSFASRGVAQSFDLQLLLKENKLVTFGQTISPLTDNGKKGIAMNGILWIDGVDFSNGTIEIDLRGKNEFQKSFLGVVFHGVDTTTYDLVYFRPFNFRAEDPVRRIHAVQYVSHPDHPWHRLRKERNGIYEKAVDPAPEETAWFHAKIVVNNGEISVFVNGAPTASLTVSKLNDRKSGRIGLWNEGLDGNFANLKITKQQ